jgi:hypothetical protein
MAADRPLGSSDDITAIQCNVGRVVAAVADRVVIRFPPVLSSTPPLFMSH